MSFIPAEQGHVVNILPPIDITGGQDADVFSMRRYQHATIIIQVGVSAGAFTKIIVNECNTFGAGAANAIPYALYSEEVDSGDTLSARTPTALAGHTPSANDNIFYVIELDHDELAEGFEYVQVQLTCGAVAILASAIVILSGARYAEEQSATEIIQT